MLEFDFGSIIFIIFFVALSFWAVSFFISIFKS